YRGTDARPPAWLKSARLAIGPGLFPCRGHPIEHCVTIAPARMVPEPNPPGESRHRYSNLAPCGTRSLTVGHPFGQSYCEIPPVVGAIKYSKVLPPRCTHRRSGR